MQSFESGHGFQEDDNAQRRVHSNLSTVTEPITAAAYEKSEVDAIPSLDLQSSQTTYDMLKKSAVRLTSLEEENLPNENSNRLKVGTNPLNQIIKWD